MYLYLYLYLIYSLEEKSFVVLKGLGCKFVPLAHQHYGDLQMYNFNPCQNNFWGECH